MTERLTTHEGHVVPKIECTAEYVEVCGVRIPRPEGLAPSHWYNFWREARRD